MSILQTIQNLKISNLIRLHPILDKKQENRHFNKLIPSCVQPQYSIQKAVIEAIQNYIDKKGEGINSDNEKHKQNKS